MFRFNPHLLRAALLGDFDLDSATLKARLCMTNTTCDSEIVALVTDFADTDTCDGANYADVTLANVVASAVAEDGSVYLDADNISFAALGAGTRQTQGVLVYDSVSGYWVSYADFSSPKTHDGDAWPLHWHALGFGQISVPTA